MLIGWCNRAWRVAAQIRYTGSQEGGEKTRGTMNGSMSENEGPTRKRPSTRKLFYGAVGLLLAGLLLLTIGVFYSWAALVLMGVVGLLGAASVFLAWLVLQIS